MRVADSVREIMFSRARELHPTLGDIFQNPVEITEANRLREIESVVQLQAKLENYLENLAALGVGL